MFNSILDLVQVLKILMLIDYVHNFIVVTLKMNLIDLKQVCSFFLTLSLFLIIHICFDLKKSPKFFV